MIEEKKSRNYISLDEAAKFCSYSQEYLSLRARQGKLKAVKLGRNWVTTEEWLEEYLFKIERHNNYSNNKGREKFFSRSPDFKKAVEPPENLPVGELAVLKIEPEFKKVKSVLVLALALALFIGGGVWGRENLRSAVQDLVHFTAPVRIAAGNYFQEIFDNFGDGAKTAEYFIKEELQKKLSQITDGSAIAGEAAGAVVGKVGSKKILVGGITVTVGDVANGASGIAGDYSEWVFSRFDYALKEIKTSPLGVDYIKVNDFLERGLKKDFHNLTYQYISVNNRLENKISALADWLAGGSREFTRFLGRVQNFAGYVKGKIFNFAEKSYRFITSPARNLIPEKEIWVSKEEFLSLESKMSELQKEPVVVKRVEVEKVVEPVKEITREVETVKQITKIDDAALADLRSTISYLEGEIGKRLYAPGGVISQTIRVTEPVQSPKIYQENGEIVLQTLGSGNVILSAATGLQLHGKQVVIESTSLLSPLIYLASNSRIDGDLAVTGAASVGEGLSVGGAASFAGGVTASGGLTVNGGITASDATSTFAGIAVTGLKMETGAADNYILTSDTSGYATWQNLSAIGPANWQFVGNNAIKPTTTVGIIVSASSTFTGTTTIANILTANLEPNNRVGIATTSPRYTLDVWGDFAVGTSTATSSTAIVPAFYVTSKDRPQIGIGTTTLGSNLFTVGTTTPSLAVTSNGNIGVGTAEPITQLHIPGRTPVRLSTIATGDYPSAIFVQGRYAYVVNQNDSTLRVFDVSDPASPTSIATTVTDTTPNSLYVQGKYAYVGTWDGSFQVFDISNPSSPTTTAEITIETGANSVYVQGRYAYVTIDGGNNLLKIIDISNPTAPAAATTTTTSADPNQVYVQGRYAYVVTGTSNVFQVFDVSDPTNPVSVATTTTGELSTHVYVQGRYAYVTTMNNNVFQVFDVSNPASPSVVATAASGIDPDSVFVQGRYAYLVNYTDNTLEVFDVSDPTNPISVALGSTGAGPSYLYVQGRYAYVLNVADDTLDILDLGGAYIQQLEAGGIEAGTLSLNNNLQVNNDVSIGGGLHVAGGFGVTGPSSIYSTSTNVAAFTVVQSNTGAIVLATSTSAMTSAAFQITNLGSGNSFVVEDSDTDSTPFVIDASGNIAVSTSTARYALDVWGDLAIGTSTDYSTPALYVDSGNGGRIGIGTTTLAGLFTVGTTTQALFIDGAGRLGINGVVYSWPSSQGGSNTFLKNDGSGGLTWAASSGGSNWQFEGPNAIRPTSSVGIIISASSTFTGTTTIANILTANLEPNNRVGIATTSPRYTLDVWGDFAVGTSTATSSTAIVPAFYVTSKDRPQIGIGTTTLGSNLFTVGTTTPAFVVSPNGSIGIGTTTPDSDLSTSLKLNVVGGDLIVSNGNNLGIIVDSLSNAYMEIYRGDTSDEGFIDFNTGRTGNFAVGLDNDGTSNFYIGTVSFGNKYLTIEPSGNIGIATTTPRFGYKLDVFGDLAVGTSTAGYGSASTTPALYVDSGNGGRIGIGTTTLAGLFTVGTTTQALFVDGAGKLGINGVAYSWPSSQGGSNTYLQNNGDGNLVWTIAAGGSNWQFEGPNAIRPTSTDVGILISASSTFTGTTTIANILTANLEPNNRVGIATSSPRYTLDVWGDLAIGTSSGTGVPQDYPMLYVNSGEGGSSNGVGIGTTTVSGTILTVGTTTPALVVSQTGNIGIGTTEPIKKITLQQTADSDGLRIYGYDDKNYDFLDLYVDSVGWNVIESTQERIEIRYPSLFFKYINTQQMAFDSVGAYMSNNIPFAFGNYLYNWEYDSANTHLELKDVDENDFLTIKDVGTTADFNFNSGQIFINSTDGSVGIATTTPRFGYKLDVFGDLAVGTSTAGYGSASSTPALYVDSGNGGRIGIGTTTLAGLLTVGTTTPRFVVAPDGNVGIASSTPSDTFAVQGNIIGSGNIVVYGTGNNATSTFNGMEAAAFKMTGSSPASGLVLTSDANGYATWQTGVGGGSNWRLTADQTALVPTSTVGIIVSASSTVAADLTIIGNSTTTGNLTAGNILFVSQATGRVGIATSSPRYTLDVWGDIGFGTSTAGYSGAGASSTPALYVDSGNGGRIGIGTTTLAGLLTVGTSTPRLVVDPAGNVGIGTDSPTSTLDIAGKLTVRGEWGGRGWSTSYDGSSYAIYSLAVYNGKLYAGQAGAVGDGDVFVFDGNTWSTSYTGSGIEEQIDSLAVYNGKLYAGQGNTAGDGDILVFNGSDWSTSYNGSENDFYSLAVYNGKLYAGQGSGSGDSDVLVFDGTNWSTSFNGSSYVIYSLAVYNGKLYAGQAGVAGDGDVFVFDGNTWSKSYDGSAGYIMSLAVYDGKLYAGQGISASDGNVIVFDGNTWSTSYDGAEEAIYELVVYNGKLYAGQGIGSGDGNILVFDGNTWLTSYNGSEEYIASMAVYNGKLYAGQGNGLGDGDILVFEENIGSQLTNLQNLTNYFSWSQSASSTQEGLDRGRLNLAAGMSINNSVGIGTTTPRYLLDVWGDIGFGTSTAGYSGAGASSTPALYVDSGNGGRIGIGTTTLAGLLTVGTTTPRFVVAPDGNVGIASSTPSDTFAVQGNIIGSGNITIYDTTATSTFSGGLMAGNNSALVVNQAASANSLYIDALGNIGIATSSPRYTLDIWGDLVVGTSTGVGVPMDYPLLYVNSGEGGSSNGVGIGTTTLAGLLTVGTTTPALIVNSSGNTVIAGDFYFNNASNNFIDLDSGNSTAFNFSDKYYQITLTTRAVVYGASHGRITSSAGNTAIDDDVAITGNLGIGTTGYNSPNKLTVVGGGAYISGGSATTTGGILAVSFDGSATTTISSATSTFAGPIVGGGAQFIIATTTGNVLLQPYGGNVGIGTTTPYAALTISESRDFAFGAFNEKVLDDMEGSVLYWTQDWTTGTSIATSTESAIVKVGGQSLKLTASSTEDEVVKKTFTSNQDLSSYEKISFWIYADRLATSTATTTQLLSFFYHDTGGTETTSTISFQKEDRWQYQEILLTSTAADKDAVDYIGFRTDFGGIEDINFYIDQIRAYNETERAAEMFVGKDGALVITGRAGVELVAPRAGAGTLPGVKVDSATVELGQPLSVNVGGDVGFDYDIQFLNTGLSQITSEGPLRIAGGDSNHAENLTLTVGGTGDIIVELANASSSLILTQSAYTTTTAFIINSENNATSTNLFQLISDVNADESVKLSIDGAGRIGVGTTTPSAFLELWTSTAGVNLVEIGTSTQRGIFMINSAGNVGIGTTTAEAKLEIAAGSLCVDDATQQNCISAGTAGDIYYGTAHGLWSDIAEAYPSNEELEPGDVVSFDAANNIYVRKSVAAYESSLAGVISTKPGMILGDDYGRKNDPLVTLAGRTPVKISIENGPIAIGDLLTSASSTPGAAMKATKSGRVIGIALEPFDGASTSAKIMVFVNPHWQGNNLSVEQNSDGQIVNSEVRQGLASLGFIVNEYGVLEVETLKTQRLCVGSVCVTEDDFIRVFGAGLVGEPISGLTPDVSSSTSGVEAPEIGSSDVCQLGQNRPCGTEVGACQIGVQVCEGGVWGECIGSVQPAAEICDGVDNNCDGEIDEGVCLSVDLSAEALMAEVEAPAEEGDDGASSIPVPVLSIATTTEIVITTSTEPVITTSIETIIITATSTDFTSHSTTTP